MVRDIQICFEGRNRWIRSGALETERGQRSLRFWIQCWTLCRKNGREALAAVFFRGFNFILAGRVGADELQSRSHTLGGLITLWFAIIPEHRPLGISRGSLGSEVEEDCGMA